MFMGREWGCAYIETSAKTRLNIDEVFTALIKKIRDSKAEKSGGGDVRTESKAKCCVIL